MEDRGLEQHAESPKNERVLQPVSADFGADIDNSPTKLPQTDPDLARLVDAWPRLSQVAKHAILAVFDSCVRI